MPILDDIMGEKFPRKPVDPAKELVETNASSAQPADLLDIARISLSQDMDTKVRAFAEARGISPERYSVREGVIVYKGDDGVTYREIPEADITNPMSIFRNIAAGLGPAVSEVPPMVTGIATAPMMLTGPPGIAMSMAATGGASVVGQKTRDFLAEQFVGPVDEEASGRRIQGQAGLSALTQGISAPLTKSVSKPALRDLSTFRQNAGAIGELEEKAAAQGIPLTPAEVTNLPSLKAQQKALANLPDTADTAEAFYRSRAGRISQRVGKFFEGISGQDSAEVAGGNIRGAAKKALTTLERKRADAAEPFYKRAFQSGAEVDTRGIIVFIDEKMDLAKGGVKKSLQKAKKLFVRIVRETSDDGAVRDVRVAETRIEGLHETKLAIDDLIDDAPLGGVGNTSKFRLQEIQKMLLTMMDAASPEYAEARRIFAKKSEPIDALKNGITGILANIKDTGLARAAAKLFNPETSGPKSLAQAKRILREADPAAWKDVKRSWLQETWERAGRETLAGGGPPINQGPKFRLLLLGDERRRAMMKAALEPEEFKAVSDLAEVLEAAGRVKPIGSDTAWNQEMMKLAREQATPRIAKLARVLNFAQYGQMVENYFTERGLARNADKVAEIIFRPGATRRIPSLLKAKPGSARFAVAFIQFLSEGLQNQLPESSIKEGAVRGLRGASDENLPSTTRISRARSRKRRRNLAARGPQSVPGLLRPAR